jgi:hypothetical protein
MENQQTGRPGSVTVALYLLWASLAITLAKFAYSLSQLAPTVNKLQPVTVMTVTLLIYGYLIFMVGSGRNWARIAFLVLFVLGLVPSLLTLQSSFGHSFVVGLVSIADLALQACGLYLLFAGPGKAWFQKKTA